MNSEFTIKFEGFKAEATKLYKEIKADEARKANSNVKFKIDRSYKFMIDTEKAAVDDFFPVSFQFNIKCRKPEFDDFSEL